MYIYHRFIRFFYCLVVINSPVFALESLYSSLDVNQCHSATAGDAFIEYQCSGIAGYNLIIDDLDHKVSLSIISPEGQKWPLDFRHHINADYPSRLGHTAEWRVLKHAQRVLPVALIARYHAEGMINENDMPVDGDVSYLTVSKITPDEICLTHVMPANESGAMQLARKLADEASRHGCYPISPEEMASVYPETLTPLVAHADGMAQGMIAEKSTLSPEEEMLFKRIQQTDKGLHYSHQVKRYYRLDPETKNKIPQWVALQFTSVAGLYFNEYQSYEVSFRPDSKVVHFQFYAGHAYHGEVTAVVTDAVYLTEYICGTNGCSTQVKKNGRVIQ